MKLKLTLIGLIFGIAVLTQTACTKIEDTSVTKDGDTDTIETEVDDTSNSSENSEEDNNVENDSNIDTTKIMDELEALTSSSEVKIVDVITYIKNNIENVPTELTTLMILRLEELQVKGQTILEDKYLSESIQLSFQKAYQNGDNFNEMEKLSDDTIRELLQETKDNGYKLEQAEGFYYPIIDYSIYQQFVSFVTPDIKDYINIKTVESEQVFAKDAALVIGWKEVINRVLATEAFLNNHGDTVKADAINELYLHYERISLFGLNNTPLFDYDTKVMNEKAKSVYEEFLSGDLKSTYLTKLKDFIEIVKANDYKLTEEVERIRNEITAEVITGTTEENRYSVAGIDNAVEFEETFHLLQDLVSKEDKKAVAEYVAYPIKVMINGTKTELLDEATFIKNYDSIMTKEVIDALLNQKAEDMFVNYKGVMVGQGEIWFNKIEGTKHTYSIYGINN
jgi:hypothetical protein